MTNFAQNTCYTETYLDFQVCFFVMAERKMAVTPVWTGI